MWSPLVDDYLLSLAAVGQTRPTIALRRALLCRVARGLDCPPEAVTAELLVAWFGSQGHWSIETRRSYRATARTFFSWAYRTGRLPVFLGDAVPQVRQRKAPPRPAPDSAYRAALDAADDRVTLMLRLAAEAGLRRAEVARVHTDDLLEGAAGWSLLVHGKGDKRRVVPIGDDLAGAVRRYRPSRGFVFPGQEDGHLSVMYVGKMVAGALPDGWTMHTLRHRFATRAFRGSRNLRAVQMLLGHTSIATTERYTAVDDDEMRAAMEAAGASVEAHR